MSSEKQEASETRVLCIEGECTVERAGEIREVLSAEMAKGEDLLLNLEGVTSVDTSFFQVICSAHRAFFKRDMALGLVGGNSDAFVRVFKSGGYERSLGCHRDRRVNCLWKEAVRDGQGHHDRG